MRLSRIRVTVVEDDLSLLHCLRMEIDRCKSLKCVGAFSNFEDARRKIGGLYADVVLLDLGLPGLDGVDAIHMIKSHWPRLKILVFTGQEERQRIYSALIAGANGLLLKSSSREELSDGIEKVYRGEAALSPLVATVILGFFESRRLLAPHLSPTEKIILAEYERGKAQKVIAAELGISIHTLRTHANRILEKSQVSSLLAASFLQRAQRNLLIA